MSDILDRLESHLKTTGWLVADRFSAPAPDAQNVSAIRWRLGSRLPPLGVEVELRLRLFESGWLPSYDWIDE